MSGIPDEEVYYKIYRPLDTAYKYTVVCMQWFDESGYTSSRFVRESSGKVIQFSSESNAVDWLDKHIKNRNLIDPKYIKRNYKKL